MFLCLILINIFRTGRNEILVGGASCKRNRFWSQYVPGIHTCESQKIKPLIRSFGERKQPVTISESISSANSHCNGTLTDKQKKHLYSLAEEDSYITFYHNQISKEVGLFTTQNNKTSIYTCFTVNLDNSSELISVNSNCPIRIDTNETFNFTFVINKNAAHLENVQKHPNYITFKVFISVTLVLTLLVVFGIQILRNENRAINTIDLSQVWRQPKFVTIELAVTTYGLAVILSSIVYLSLLHSRQEHFIKIINSGMIGFIIPSIIRVVLSKYIGEDHSTVHLSLAPLIYNIFFILPLSGANWFGVIFYGSLRGYGGHISLLISFIFSSLMVFVCKISGRIGNFINVHQITDPALYMELTGPKKIISFREIICILSYISVGFMVSKDLLKCSYDYYLLNIPLDIHLIIDRLIIFAFTSTTISGFRTFNIYKNNLPSSWMSGNVIQNFLLAMFVGLREVWRLLFDLIYNYHFEASVYYATCVMATIGVVIGIGSGFSLIISFIITFSVFRERVNDVIEIK